MLKVDNSSLILCVQNCYSQNYQFASLLEKLTVLLYRKPWLDSVKRILHHLLKVYFEIYYGKYSGISFEE